MMVRTLNERDSVKVRSTGQAERLAPSTAPIGVVASRMVEGKHAGSEQGQTRHPITCLENNPVGVGGSPTAPKGHGNELT